MPAIIEPPPEPGMPPSPLWKRLAWFVALAAAGALATAAVAYALKLLLR
jgi:predicted cobalt transporter CbtA